MFQYSILAIIFACFYSFPSYGCDGSTDFSEGLYVTNKISGFQSNSLNIQKNNNLGSFEFDLNTVWSARKNDDGSMTNIGNFRGAAEIKGCFSFYHVDENCSLIFYAKNSQKIEIVSFGTCLHGYNAYPDGIYNKSRRDAKK